MSRRYGKVLVLCFATIAVTMVINMRFLDPGRPTPPVTVTWPDVFGGNRHSPPPILMWRFTSRQKLVASSSSGNKRKLSSCAATASITHSGTWYVVDDGCALGHLPKDAGTLLAVDRALLENGEPGLQGVVFMHPCASVASLVASRPARDNTLFGNVLRYWFLAAASVIDGRNNQSGMSSLRFEDVASLERTAHCFERVVGRHPSWRWFGPLGRLESETVASELRNSFLRTVGTADELSQLQNASTVTVLVVVRRSNRRFSPHVDSLAESLRRLFNARFGPDASTLVTVAQTSFEVTTPLALQAARIVRADVVVAAHGAALSIVGTVLRPGSAVIEVFPYGFRYSIFEELIKVSGFGRWYAAVEGLCPLGSCARGTSCRSENNPAPAGDTAYMLRLVNGHSRCKNCDIAWSASVCQPSGSEALLKNEPLLAAILEGVRHVLLFRASNGLPIADVQQTSVRLVDRRA